jgi:hypothetical protein
MSSIPLSLRDELIAALRDTEQQTEEIFMVLAESLPALVAEMQQSLDRSQSALDCMSAGQDGCGDGLQIATILEEARSRMEHGAHHFREMSHTDSELFSQLQTGIQQLHGITTLIDGIRMDSEDMELVSLNAMTVALKAGNAGRAFSYITEELKRLATRTIRLAESISRRGEDLLQAFKELEGALDDTREFQSALIESFEKRIFSSFDDFRGAVSETVNGLRELHEASSALRRPVTGLMEAIQLQDLIRQSIDHIILALEAIRPEDQFTTSQDLLDELAFVRQIPDLAVSLIEDVAGQIDDSVATFLRLIDEAEKMRGELEADRERFIKGGGPTETGRDDDRTDLDGRFVHATTLLQELLNDLDRSIQKKELLVTRSTSITRDVEDLEDQFRSFNTLVTRFHSIDIASRIEVAKQSVLRTMGTTSNQMNALTKQIERDVEGSLNATREFMKTTSAVISRHQNEFHEQRGFVEEFSVSIRERYERLEASREELTTVVEGFSLFTDGFYQVFERSKANGSRLSSLNTSLRGLKDRLDRMQREIDDRYQQELREQGLESWTIGNDRLQEIIERFTIFSHKQRASALVGIDVEEGVEAGEVTLF